MNSLWNDDARWNAIWSAMGLAAPDHWHERLLTSYREPQRHYHTLEHVAECLREFGPVRRLALKPALVELAIWFHDAVYDPRLNDNEERSADLASQCLQMAGADKNAQDYITHLVLATKHHVASTPDEALLIDIDLSILGQPADRFAEYEKQIGQEYSWVPADVFAKKRSDILHRFLARPRIYVNEHFFARYETTARANLNGSLERLRHGLS